MSEPVDEINNDEHSEQEVTRMKRDAGEARNYVNGAEFHAAEKACDAAMDTLKRAETMTMESWWVVGDFFQKCRYAALALAGTNDIQDPRYKKRFGNLVDNTKARNVDAVTRSKLLVLVDDKEAVIDWWENHADPRKKARWLHPTTMLKHFKAFNKPKPKDGPKKPDPKEKTEHEPNTPEEVAQAIHQPLGNVTINADAENNVAQILAAIDQLGLDPEARDTLLGAMSVGLFNDKKGGKKGRSRK